MKIYKKTLLTSSFEVIELPDKELGKGGQARVYKINTQGYEDYCVKIYISSKSANENLDRITYMIKNPPNNIQRNSGFRICWPIALAYDLNKNFIGYIMPLAFSDSRDLKILEIYNSKPIAQQSKYKKYPEWHHKYELNDAIGMKNRMKMLCNWAIAIHCIHETRRYVIIDLKPENVMATATGKISIVDTDSFQISENGKTLFPGVAYTAAYFPPEGKIYQQQKLPFPCTCDYFAAAVVFYKILTGVHPYGGTNLLPPYDTLETEEDCIQEGLFAYGNKKQFIRFPLGLNLQENFKNLPLTIQQLFIRAFDADINCRPTMEEWGRMFKEVIVSNRLKGHIIKLPISTYPSIKITNVSFCDSDFNGMLLHPKGSILYTDVTYLTPYLDYKVLKQGSPIIIWYKIFNPTGILESGNGSKKGFTGKGEIQRNAPSLSINLPGWGNTNKTCYNIPGIWRIEFYENDICLYKTSFEIKNKPHNAVPLVTNKPVNSASLPKSTPIRSPKKKKSKSTILLLLSIVAVLFFTAYYFLYIPYVTDRDAPRYFTFTNLNLRSSEIGDVEYNLLGLLPYGTELITYSVGDEWANVKAHGKKGFVASSLVLSAEDFHLLNSAWGNTDAKECIATAKCRLAVLDYYKRSYLKGGIEWQIYTKKKEDKTNNVFFPRVFDRNSKFTDFAFIVKNNQTQKRMFVLYSFDDETEAPLFRYNMEAPKEGYIKNIESLRSPSSLRLIVSYSDGTQQEVILNINNSAQPSRQEQLTESSAEHTSQVQDINKMSAKELNQQGNTFYEKKDYRQAITYYRKASEKGFPEAFANLGWIYYQGLGVPVDGAIAISYLKDAMTMGNLNGGYYLGLLYENGIDNRFYDMDKAIAAYKQAAYGGHEKAVESLKRLADNGNRYASLYIATLYKDGAANGTFQNRELAIHYYRLAAEKGVDEAINALRELNVESN